MAKKLAKKLSSSSTYEPRLLKLKNDLSYLTRRADTQMASNYTVDGRMKLVPLLFISIVLLMASFLLFFVLSNFSSVLKQAGITSILITIQSIIAMAFPLHFLENGKARHIEKNLNGILLKSFFVFLLLSFSSCPPLTLALVATLL